LICRLLCVTEFIYFFVPGIHAGNVVLQRSSLCNPYLNSCRQQFRDIENEIKNRKSLG
jgi:hypothetical protein